MEINQYPSLFVSADRAAKKMQAAYFRLLFLQYALLTAASALTLFSGIIEGNIILALYLSLLILGSVFSLLLATQRPNQEWYRMRALAESVKTLSWRYMMKSDPFPEEPDKNADFKFAERLQLVLSVHGASSAALVKSIEIGSIITESMQRIRSLPFADKKAIYLRERVQEQLSWYRAKAVHNRKMGTLYSFGVVTIYLAAIGLTAFQFWRESIFGNSILWISEPLLVLAASVLGVSQARRYSELAASYSLTAMEIQRLELNFRLIEGAGDLAPSVNNAEAAFSREHTQWMARQA